MTTIKIALLGFGTVAQGTFNLLQDNAELIRNRTGVNVEISKIFVRNPDKYSHITLPETAQYVTDIDEGLKDDSIQMVVELMGGTNFAKDCVEGALKAKKNVVTANKDLLAEAGPYLLDLASKNGVDLRFEASVLGGIPIIRTLYESLAGNRITEIIGIMNGTTNFILTKMSEEGLEYNDVLSDAQAKGYAERNPDADVEGYDACRKIAILASLATEKTVSYDDIYTEGITKITDIDFKYAEKMGTSIKLFGTSRIKDGKVSAYVAPVMISKNNPLYSVNDVFNGIVVKGNMLGTSMFYGSGAGKLPTASAVVADIIEAVQNIDKNVPLGWTDEKQEILPMDQTKFRYFIRVAGSYRNKEQELNEYFGKAEVVELYGMDEFAILTKEMTEGELKAAASAFDTKAQSRSEYGIKQMIRAAL